MERNKSFPDSDMVTQPPSCSADTMSTVSGTLSDVPSHVVIKARIHYGDRWAACKGMFMEYSKSTSIHGVRYLFEVHRPVYEKVCWFFLLAISLCVSLWLIWDTYLKWQNSPVILGFDETLVPIHKIPFPTVTICPEVKSDRNIFDFANVSRQILHELKEHDAFNNYGNLTMKELEQFAATLHICEVDVGQRFASYLPKDICPDVAKTLVDLSVSKNETGMICMWNGHFYFCEKIFTFVATDEGICYQFNGLQTKDIYRDERFMSYNDKDVIDYNNVFYDRIEPLNNITGNWSLDDGYVGQGINSYPQRTIYSSIRKGFLSVLQSFEHNFEWDCRSFKQGYKVYLNSPESVPLTAGNYILVSHGDEVMVSVLPAYVISTQNLHDYSPEKRQCFFNDERYLRFFRSYSQSNCQTECLVNHTISKCGCTKFWMPKPLDVPVCGVADMDCYNDAQKELNLIIQNQTVHKTINDTVKIICDCMPACNSLDYNVEISRAHYNLSKTVAAWRETYEEHPDYRTSRLLVFFKEHQFTAIKRTVLFSTTTLISNFGGIFGLFLGVSGLSVIEVFYFFTMRFLYNLRKRRRNKRKLLKIAQGHES